MVRLPALTALLVAVASTVLAAEPARRTPAAIPEPAREPAPASAETPAIIRDALSGVGLFHQHQGRDGLDPATTARERRPGDR